MPVLEPDWHYTVLRRTCIVYCNACILRATFMSIKDLYQRLFANIGKENKNSNSQDKVNE